MRSPDLNVIVAEIFSDESVSKKLLEYGFRLYLYEPRDRKLVEGTAKQAGNNGIYIKDLEKAKKRILNGDKIIYCDRIL